MKFLLKPLKDQVIIITGASSGIGLATAKMAAKKGARVVAAARNEEALNQLTEEINSEGGKAIYVKADVGIEKDVARIADTAIRSYGTFDTWINNADISILGGCFEVSIEEMRRMFDTNFWGVVYGSRVAANHFRTRGESGALINISSFAEERSMEIQTPYSISKRAVHEWTSALRAELEKDKTPVSVSLIHLGKVDSVYTESAFGNSGLQYASHRSPMTVSEGVPKAILHCAERPKRDLYINSQSKFFTVLDSLKPKFPEKTFSQINTLTDVEGIDLQISAAENSTVIEQQTQHSKPQKRSIVSSLVLAGVGTAILLLSKKKNKSTNSM